MIVGVDPGGTTGLSWWDEATQRLEATAQQSAQHAVSTLWAWLEEHAPQLSVEVACERFQIGPRTLQASRQYDALHVAGAVRFKCGQLGVPYCEYPPATSKRLATNERLQLLRLYRPGQGHANDATRQVIAHLVSTRPRVFEQLVLDAQHRLG